MMVDISADTARLLGVLYRLVKAGNSLIVVEHNLDAVKAADWVIALGPKGGAGMRTGVRSPGVGIWDSFSA